MIKLTCNQLILLLSIRRGTSWIKIGTYGSDRKALLKAGYLMEKERRFGVKTLEVTAKGESRIRLALLDI